MNRALDLFFYGLFMDRSLLADKGLVPKILGRAQLDDYELRIGERATLVPRSGGACFGIAAQLGSREVDELYSDPSVADYRPEHVRISLLSEADSIEAVCYNLPPDLIGTSVNEAYIESLARLAAKLNLPSPYVQRIKSLAKIPGSAGSGRTS